MMELVVLLMSAMPFLVGLYALRVLENRRNDDGDDPPPPDSGPDYPMDPFAPGPRRERPATPRNASGPRAPIRRLPTRMPTRAH